MYYIISMKNYVKTNDGHIYRLTGQETIFNTTVFYEIDLNVPYADFQHTYRVSADDIIKDSDNIEDLFNVIILLETYDNEKYYSTLYKENLEYYKRLECFAGNTKTKKGIDYEIYGAIWTTKGLIYVAKMNRVGEWELF